MSDHVNISTNCSHCGKKYRVKKITLGRIASCKHCGKKFKIVEAINDYQIGFVEDDNYTIPENPILKCRNCNEIVLLKQQPCHNCGITERLAYTDKTKQNPSKWIILILLCPFLALSYLNLFREKSINVSMLDSAHSSQPKKMQPTIVPVVNNSNTESQKISTVKTDASLNSSLGIDQDQKNASTIDELTINSSENSMTVHVTKLQSKFPGHFVTINDQANGVIIKPGILLTFTECMRYQKNPYALIETKKGYAYRSLTKITFTPIIPQEGLSIELYSFDDPEPHRKPLAINRGQLSFPSTLYALAWHNYNSLLIPLVHSPDIEQMELIYTDGAFLSPAIIMIPGEFVLGIFAERKTRIDPITGNHTIYNPISPLGEAFFDALDNYENIHSNIRSSVNGVEKKSFTLSSNLSTRLHFNNKMKDFNFDDNKLAFLHNNTTEVALFNRLTHEKICGVLLDNPAEQIIIHEDFLLALSNKLHHSQLYSISGNHLLWTNPFPDSNHFYKFNKYHGQVFSRMNNKRWMSIDLNRSYPQPPLWQWVTESPNIVAFSNGTFHMIPDKNILEAPYNTKEILHIDNKTIYYYGSLQSFEMESVLIPNRSTKLDLDNFRVGQMIDGDKTYIESVFSYPIDGRVDSRDQLFPILPHLVFPGKRIDIYLKDNLIESDLKWAGLKGMWELSGNGIFCTPNMSDRIIPYDLVLFNGKEWIGKSDKFYNTLPISFYFPEIIDQPKLNKIFFSTDKNNMAFLCDQKFIYFDQHNKMWTTMNDVDDVFNVDDNYLIKQNRLTVWNKLLGKTLYESPYGFMHNCLETINGVTFFNGDSYASFDLESFANNKIPWRKMTNDKYSLSFEKPIPYLDGAKDYNRDMYLMSQKSELLSIRTDGLSRSLELHYKFNKYPDSDLRMGIRGQILSLSDKNIVITSKYIERPAYFPIAQTRNDRPHFNQITCASGKGYVYFETFPESIIVNYIDASTLKLQKCQTINTKIIPDKILNEGGKIYLLFQKCLVEIILPL
jgi:hypothetical protein